MADRLAGDNSNLSVVVLAAGEGKRMKSALPKVLHKICGRSLVECVLDPVDILNPGEAVLVVGIGADEVAAAAGKGRRVALQPEQKGTGHAVMVALEEMDPRFTEVMVLAGDTPLITEATLSRLVAARRETGSAASLLTTELSDPSGYGRVLRSASSEVREIVEEADADDEQRAVNEVNTSIYVFDRAALAGGLAGLDTDNQQGEYYLTDVAKHFNSTGLSVIAVEAPADEVLGINDRAQLARAAGIMRGRINRELMAVGVAVVDPSSTYIDQGVEVGRETVIMPMVFLTGETKIGEGCSIGPCTSINDTSVAEGCNIQFSVIDGCEIASGVEVGPFSRLRPGTELGPGTRAGSFVEMKKTKLGRGSKVPHLSYMGDATIGEETNVGAGSITCNYDGESKYPTTIGDRAFIGSDTMMVAPVKIGDDAVTGAGSVISKDVPDGSLAIERVEQEIVKDYRSRKRGNKPKER
jgi:bifunctional UDP-N-acetylglucosamine pyrophosphorylase/glucosamine-1-phosphate N-acetyltransferase